MKYQHTIVLETEINTEKMSGFTLMNWLATPEDKRTMFLNECASDVIKALLKQANDGGSWAFIKVAE